MFWNFNFSVNEWMLFWGHTREYYWPCYDQKSI